MHLLLGRWTNNLASVKWCVLMRVTCPSLLASCLLCGCCGRLLSSIIRGCVKSVDTPNMFMLRSMES
jgi:hypothetical protein